MLRHLSEQDIRRLILRMLQQKVLKECFKKLTVQGSIQNIQVYIQVGRQHHKLLEGRMKITLSQGISKDSPDFDTYINPEPIQSQASTHIKQHYLKSSF